MTEIPELTNDEWAEYLERLTYYADNKFLAYGWMGNSKKSERIGPRAISPQDLAAEAILSVIQKRRRYNPDHDLMKFLQSIVDSTINNLSNLAEHKVKKPLVQETYEQVDNLTSVGFPGNEPEPSRICISKELVEKLKASLTSDFNKDKLIRGLFECMEGGITKRREIAQLLGVRVKEVDNARKRLYRRIREISRL
jgi:DNA-directed RNA polymerase specialized sigma24 family protein